jgi:hypothetical protein
MEMNAAEFYIDLKSLKEFLVYETSPELFHKFVESLRREIDLCSSKVKTENFEVQEKKDEHSTGYEPKSDAGIVLGIIVSVLAASNSDINLEQCKEVLVYLWEKLNSMLKKFYKNEYVKLSFEITDPEKTISIKVESDSPDKAYILFDKASEVAEVLSSSSQTTKRIVTIEPKMIES